MTDKKILKVTVRNKKNMHIRMLRDYMEKILAGLTKDAELTKKYHIMVTTDDIDMEILGESEPKETYSPSEWVGAVVGLEEEGIEYEELDLCAFIEDNIKLANWKGACDTSLYPHQYNAINEFEDNQMSFMIGARQGGITTTAMVYAMAKAFINPRTRIHFFSNRYDSAGQICQDMANSFDVSGMLLGNTIPTKNKIDFHNNSIIKFKSITSTNLSGTCIQKDDIIIIDNAGYSRSTHENHQLIERALSVGAKIIMLTTGEPKYGSVFSAWNFSYTKIKSITILAPWTSVRKKKGFKEEQTRIIGEVNWRREYDFL